MFIDYASAKRAVAICGFGTVAMLDYLERSGVFVRSDRTKRRGRGRRYNFRDLIVLKTISSLLNNGASVSAIKKSLQQFQNDKWSADRGNLSFDESPLKYLIVSNGTVIYGKSNDTLYDLSKSGQMLFNFIVDIDKVHSDIINALEQRELPLQSSKGRKI